MPSSTHLKYLVNRVLQKRIKMIQVRDLTKLVSLYMTTRWCTSCPLLRTENRMYWHVRTIKTAWHHSFFAISLVDIIWILVILYSFERPHRDLWNEYKIMKIQGILTIEMMQKLLCHAVVIVRTCHYIYYRKYLHPTDSRSKPCIPSPSPEDDAWKSC